MRSTALSLILGGAVFAAACGGHNSPVSPAAPSTAPAAAAAPASSGATISGTVLGMSTASRIRAMSVGMTVGVAGTSTSAPVDGAGHFMLQNVPAGSVTLQFTGPSTNAALTLPNVAANSTMTISVQVSGTTAQLANDETEGPDNEAEVEGIVTAVGKNTLMVAGRTVTVGPSTTIVHGGTTLTLADIHVGDRVHVEGTLSGTGSSATIAAKKIEDQDGVATPGEGGDKNPNGGDQGGNDGGPSSNGGQIDLTGTLSGRTGTCPAITFTVSSTKVVTSSATEFSDTSCTALTNGMTVEVRGTKQANGSVAATEVKTHK